jgi:hypothetical protein
MSMLYHRKNCPLAAPSYVHRRRSDSRPYLRVLLALDIQLENTIRLWPLIDVLVSR